MSDAMIHHPDPELDLLLERSVGVPPDLVWQAWTTPEHIKKWFTPAPWKTVDCEIDLRPGGIFRTVMQSPEGQEYPNIGCYLEIVPGRKLVWTNALLPGFRPNGAPNSCPDESFLFTCVLTLEAQGSGTKWNGPQKRDRQGWDNEIRDPKPSLIPQTEPRA